MNTGESEDRKSNSATLLVCLTYQLRRICVYVVQNPIGLLKKSLHLDERSKYKKDKRDMYSSPLYIAKPVPQILKQVLTIDFKIGC